MLSMTKVDWDVSEYLLFKGRKIPLAEETPQCPIREYSPLVRRAVSIVKPLDQLQRYLFTSGFIYRTIGKWIRENIDENTVFLDIGCGDLELRNELTTNVFYNAFDVSFSEYTLDLALRLDCVNLAIASATNIPLDSNQVSMLTAIEVLEHIPDINKALNEIRRVALPDALFLVSIPNNFCHKYAVKGQHGDHCNSWTYNGFIDHMSSRGFKLIKSTMTGWWLPFPSCLARNVSVQLPITSEYEYYNTNFFFMFQVVK